MPWEPKTRESRIDVTIHLDKWVVLAPSLQSGKEWIRIHFRLIKALTGSKRMLVSPVFDPTDIFEVIIVTEHRELEGLMYYEFMDIRPRINLLHEEITGKNLANIAWRHVGIRSQNTFIHPHPEPEEKDRDRLDLCGRWLKGDPVSDLREHDKHSIPDGGFGVAPPEWLRRRR